MILVTELTWLQTIAGALFKEVVLFMLLLVELTWLGTIAGALSKVIVQYVILKLFSLVDWS